MDARFRRRGRAANPRLRRAAGRNRAPLADLTPMRFPQLFARRAPY